MRIGFLDHHLNNYHANKFLSILNGELAAEGAKVVIAYESDAEGEDWCAKNGVKRASSPEEVLAESDAIMNLAPDNPESHLPLAREVLKSGKTMFFDKSLAKSLEDAREIVAVAKKHNAPIMSSSSLRFALEVEELIARSPAPYEAVFGRGFGKWRGYATHTVGPVLRLFGTGVKRVIDTGTAGARMVTLDDGRRRATVELREAENQDEACPWVFGALKGERYEFTGITKYHEFYANLQKEILAFFKSGKAPLSTDEMLLTVAVEAAAEESMKRGGEWIDIKLM